MSEKIPEIYKVIFSKISEREVDGKVPMEWVRHVIRFIFRIPKENVRTILHEMQSYSLIEMTCSKFVYLGKNGTKIADTREIKLFG